MIRKINLMTSHIKEMNTELHEVMNFVFDMIPCGTVLFNTKINIQMTLTHGCNYAFHKALIDVMKEIQTILTKLT